VSDQEPQKPAGTPMSFYMEHALKLPPLELAQRIREMESELKRLAKPRPSDVAFLAELKRRAGGLN
jgi:hypothetical protein